MIRHWVRILEGVDYNGDGRHGICIRVWNLDSDDSDAGDILTTLGTIRRQLVGHCHRSSSLCYRFVRYALPKERVGLGFDSLVGIGFSNRLG